MLEMKRCSRCGEENKDENRFCHNCGAKLDSFKPEIAKMIILLTGSGMLIY